MLGSQTQQCGAVMASSAGLLARAFDAAPNGFVLVDHSGSIVAANAQIERMFGLANEALVGRQIEELLPNSLREAHVGLRQAFLARPALRAMGVGRVLYARRADGYEFPVEVGLNPVSSPEGQFVLASVVDISERMALESAFRGLFDSTPVGLLVVNDDGDIEMANRVLADSLGYTPQDLTGKSMSTLLPERYRERHGPLMAHYRASGESRMMGGGRDLTALHVDGTELPVEIGLSRVHWRRQMMTLAAVTSISKRKQLELELRQANANLQEFTYVASHDLRSPLRGISDLTEWIREDLGEHASPSVVKNLNRVAQRIQRMERLIDDLLSYARAGQMHTTFSQVNLDEMVRGILEIQPVPDGFRVDLDVGVSAFQATRTPLETVLRNLISNAVKHHDRHSGIIRVQARHEDSFCELCVIDDGPGVPEQACERIFKLFQTLTASERAGSGIGLAITRRLVEVHGGRIEVSSPVSEGRGTCFRFWWPRFPLRCRDER